MKTKLKTTNALRGLLSGLLLLAAGTLTANASTTLGPGVAVAGGSTDSQIALIVDRLVTSSVSAGTYDVTNFDVRINVSGGGRSVTPFLAVGSPSNYTTIWFGPTFTPSSTGVQNISYILGTQQFTLGSGQTVFAGLDINGGTSVDLITSGGLTDIRISDLPNVTSVGQTLNTFNAPGNAQKYSFDIVFAATPEPGRALLLMVGLMGAVIRRRRKW